MSGNRANPITADSILARVTVRGEIVSSKRDIYNVRDEGKKVYMCYYIPQSHLRIFRFLTTAIRHERERLYQKGANDRRWREGPHGLK